MRLIALLIVIAIIYVAWSRRGLDSFVSKAMKEADAVEPAATPRNPPTVYPPAAQPAAQAQPSSGLRRPIDRTRAVMEQVQQRAAEPF